MIEKDKVVIAGECRLVNQIDGDCTLNTIIDGDCVLNAMIDGIVGEVLKYSLNEYYEGEYAVIPKANREVILETTEKTMRDDVTVKKIPFFEAHNADGVTVYIGSEV